VDGHEVALADKSIVQVQEKGKVRLRTTLGKGDVVLEEVLLIPTLSKNLFSVRIAVRKGWSAHFSEDDVKLFLNNEVILIGKDEGGDLWKLQAKAVVQSSCNEASRTGKSLNLWHQRMAHVNQEYLLLMDKNKTVKGLDIQGGKNDKQFCEGCTLGKQSRHSFKSLNRERKAAPGKLIHCDLCGPIHVTSAGGMRYFMKDDYSDYRTVFFLKEKSADEVTERIQDFLNQVKCELPKGLDSFYCLKIDKGLEFMNEKLESLL
jgi:hypothetical protein